MSNKLLTSKGFTLLELLIAISIVGILATIGLVSYNKAQETSRDFRRKQDLRALQTASELYYQKNKAYPNRTVNSTSWGGLSTDLAPTYINVLPLDPTNSSSSNLFYLYTSTSPTTYTLCTNLENNSDKDRVIPPITDCTGYATADFSVSSP